MEFPKVNMRYWSDRDKAALREARSFVDLTPVALMVLKRMPRPVSMVCGPITSGGTGNIELNLAVFNAAIVRLISQGRIVFSQMPFEEHVFRIKATIPPHEHNTLLDAFYLPIFKSGRITYLHFIHGWETSGGAAWEHERGIELGLSVTYLPPDFVDLTNLPRL